MEAEHYIWIGTVAGVLFTYFIGYRVYKIYEEHKKKTPFKKGI